MKNYETEERKIIRCRRVTYFIHITTTTKRIVTTEHTRENKRRKISNENDNIYVETLRE